MEDLGLDLGDSFQVFLSAMEEINRLVTEINDLDVNILVFIKSGILKTSLSYYLNIKQTL